MTRTLLQILIILFLGKSGGEFTEGIYCNSGVYHSICYTFNENRTFEMSYFTCTDLIFGVGKYDLSRKKITLYFEKDTLHKDNSHFTINCSPTNNDSINMTIQSYQLDGNPIPLSIIKVSDANSNILFAGSADLEGNLEIKFPNSSEKVIVTTKSAFNQELETSVNLNQNTAIKFYLDQKRTLMEDTTIVLKIRRRTESEIFLKSGAKYEKE